MKLLRAVGFGAVALAAGFVAACAASGTEGTGASDDAGSYGGDDSGSPIDGSPITGDSGGGKDAGTGEAGSCVVTPPGSCGVFPQCGCTDTTCDFQEAGTSPACNLTAGTGDGGAACASSADCDPGLTCLFARCRSYCGVAGAACTGIYSDCHQHGGNAKYLVCGIKCELSDPASCGGGGEGCVGVQASGAIQTSECEPVGAGTNGSTCVNQLDCSPGFSCVNTGTSNCRQTCKYPGGACTTGTCMEYASPFLIVDGQEYGFCN